MLTAHKLWNEEIKFDLTVQYEKATTEFNRYFEKFVNVKSSVDLAKLITSFKNKYKSEVSEELIDHLEKLKN